MKKKIRFVPFCLCLGAMVLFTGCNAANTSGLFLNIMAVFSEGNAANTDSDKENKCTPAVTGEENTKAATRDFFVNVDKSSQVDDIVKSIGNPYEITGSGISTYHWYLEEGGTARVVFDLQGIVSIFICDESDKAEALYRRN